MLFSLLGMAQGGSSSQHYFYTGANEHIIQYHAGGTAGSTVEDVTAAAGAPLAASVSGGLTSYSLPGDAEHVYFIGSNLHVNELVCCWSVNDVSAAAGSPYPTSTGALTSFVDSAGEHVFYLGANQNVYQLWYSYGSSEWFLQDLTTSSGGPLAAAGSHLTSFADSFGEHIVYMGTNEHVYQIYYNSSHGNWVDQDLTATTSGVSAASGSALSSFADNSGEHVIYIGADLHIFQFYYPASGTGWIDQDLNGLASNNPGPAASGSGLTSFSDPSDYYYGPGGEHVFYVSSGLQVSELLFTGSVWQGFPNLPGNMPVAQGSLALTSLPGYDNGTTPDFEQFAYIGPVNYLTIMQFTPGSFWFFPCSDCEGQPSPMSSLTSFLDR